MAGSRRRVRWQITDCGWRVLLTIICIALFPTVAHAKFSKEFKGSFEKIFSPAIPHKGLETAAYPLEPDKLKTFVVVEKAGLIPADRAFYLIQPGVYDYIGAIVEEDGQLKERPGPIYTRIPKGTIMAVAGEEYFGRTVYLKLISIKKIPSLKYPTKKPTNVTVMLGFKFSKDVIKAGKMQPIVSRIEEWVKPFSTYADALRHSQEITGELPATAPK